MNVESNDMFGDVADFIRNVRTWQTYHFPKHLIYNCWFLRFCNSLTSEFCWNQQCDWSDIDLLQAASAPLFRPKTYWTDLYYLYMLTDYASILSKGAVFNIRPAYQIRLALWSDPIMSEFVKICVLTVYFCRNKPKSSKPPIGELRSPVVLSTASHRDVRLMMKTPVSFC